MDEPYLVALDVLASLGSGHDERRNRAAEIAPDFVRLAIGFAYGEIFSRPGLDLRTRISVSIATLVTAGGSVGNLRQLVASALDVGWSRQEIAEMFVQTAAHLGTHRALEALADCHDLLAEMDPCSQSCDGGISDTGQV